MPCRGRPLMRLAIATRSCPRDSASEPCGSGRVTRPRRPARHGPSSSSPASASRVPWRGPQPWAAHARRVGVRRHDQNVEAGRRHLTDPVVDRVQATLAASCATRLSTPASSWPRSSCTVRVSSLASNRCGAKAVPEAVARRPRDDSGRPHRRRHRPARRTLVGVVPAAHRVDFVTAPGDSRPNTPAR